MTEDLDLLAALDDLAAADLEAFPDGLAEDDLVSYVAGDLPAAEKDRVQTILTASPQARARLFALRRAARLKLPDEEPIVEVLPPGQKAEDLAKLKARLGIGTDAGETETETETEEPPLPFPAPTPTPAPTPPASTPWFSIAATVACALLGGALLFTGLQLSDKKAPTGHVDVRFLFPDGAIRGPSEPTEPGAKIDAEPSRILLQLAAVRRSVGDPDPDRYRVEIVRRNPSGGDQTAGEMVWSEDDFPSEKDGAFNLLLDREFLPSGQYLVRLYGFLDGASLGQIATYSFDL